jgi:DNA-binding FadR family transcriptional regulator
VVERVDRLIERTSPRIKIVSRHAAAPALHEGRRALHQSNVTFGHLHEALLVLEPSLTRLATLRANADDLTTLADNLSAQAAALRDYDTWNRLDQDFHLTIAAIAGNPALALARAPITEILMPVLHRFMLSEKLTRRALGFHERILEEMQLRDEEAAALMTRKHVDDFRRGWELAGLSLDQPIDALDHSALEAATQAAARAA